MNVSFIVFAFFLLGNEVSMEGNIVQYFLSRFVCNIISLCIRDFICSWKLFVYWFMFEKRYVNKFNIYRGNKSKYLA